ncbi:hypothetical protein BX265_7723 [Streptomyces sp. TLI_235]|nr:hypothetical protein BX265_7723 [Streptomyces sp. TLI_235]
MVPRSTATAAASKTSSTRSPNSVRARSVSPRRTRSWTPPPPAAGSSSTSSPPSRSSPANASSRAPARAWPPLAPAAGSADAPPSPPRKSSRPPATCCPTPAVPSPRSRSSSASSRAPPQPPPRPARTTYGRCAPSARSARAVAGGIRMRGGAQREGTPTRARERRALREGQKGGAPLPRTRRNGPSMWATRTGSDRPWMTRKASRSSAANQALTAASALSRRSLPSTAEALRLAGPPEGLRRDRIRPPDQGRPAPVRLIKTRRGLQCQCRGARDRLPLALAELALRVQNHLVDRREDAHVGADSFRWVGVMALGVRGSPPDASGGGSTVGAAAAGAERRTDYGRA